MPSLHSRSIAITQGNGTQNQAGRFLWLLMFSIFELETDWQQTLETTDIQRWVVPLEEEKMRSKNFKKNKQFAVSMGKLRGGNDYKKFSLHVESTTFGFCHTQGFCSYHNQDFGACHILDHYTYHKQGCELEHNQDLAVCDKLDLVIFHYNFLFWDYHICHPSHCHPSKHTQQKPPCPISCCRNAKQYNMLISWSENLKI